jgi:predicted transposase YdaD
MRESATYQAILEEGRAQGRIAEARALLVLLGEQKFGPADARMRAALEAIGDADRLEALARRMLAATSWDNLLRRA